MGRKYISDSGFVTRNAFAALVVCAVTCFAVTRTLLAFFQGSAPANVSQRTITFAERVAYQHAIEDVYWRHRIWPKERPDPKPSLDSVMSRAQLDKKVTDYLRKSQALEDYWQRPITAEQLQAEMDRMAKHTKQPEVLRELFEALGNDPFVIAECLARPALAERLLTNWYASDQRIHAELRDQAQAELQAHPSIDQMKQLSGTYTEVEFVKSDGGETVGQAHRLPIKKLPRIAAARQQQHSHHVLTLDSSEWDKTVQRLARAFNISPREEPDQNLLMEMVSSLQEDESHYHVTAVISKTHDHLKLATVSWNKEAVASWLVRVETEQPHASSDVAGGYTLPEIAEGGCIDDTWTITAAAASARHNHSAVWTGSEMIVWGGAGVGEPVNTGGRYSPATDTWTATTTTASPSGRQNHTAVWTGSEMIVWGGVDCCNGSNTGGKYNPAADTWLPTSNSNVPSGRYAHTVVWTGSEMIVWGGRDTISPSPFDTGGRYNPAADSWTSTSTANAPSGRMVHTAIWSGSEMIVWGGLASSDYFNSGARYNPATNSWTPTTTANAPTARSSHTAIWTGAEMIVWGGGGNNGVQNTGARYDPTTNAWIATNTSNAPSARAGHTSVWTGKEMLVWGGVASNSGGRYDPGSDTWATTSQVNAPFARGNHTAVWANNEMIIWGGYNFSSTDTGGRYSPSTDSWLPTSSAAPARLSHTAVWTGSEMIIWGGNDYNGTNFDNGGRYDPSIDTWSALSIASAPAARYLHVGIWTGKEMIIWGGINGPDYFNTGGRYNPGTDTWTATSTTSAPAVRQLTTAIWTGSEMIVWGGYLGVNGNHYLDTGGKYNPGTDSWVATSIINAPHGRFGHSAIWTGSEMIVWGGAFADTEEHYLNTGGRYNPNSNSWVATTLTDAPEGRSGHTAVWTGSDMIVWGGGDLFNGFNTGGRYNPNTNSWVATSMTNVPDGRIGHTAIWSGVEMIAWGGNDGFNPFKTGGRYAPATDSWIATSITNAPSARDSHTAVWTGSEMIIWGGYNSSLETILGSGGKYCAQSGPSPTPTATPTPTPTPTPCTGRCSPTPRPRPTPAPRP